MVQETLNRYHVQYRILVSAKFGTYTIITTRTDQRLSTCILTGLRIWSLLTLDTQDYTSSIALFSLFNELELTLGMVVASLPVCQPVVSSFNNSQLGCWITTSLRFLGGSSAASAQNHGSGPEDGIYAEGKPRAAAAAAKKSRQPTFWSRRLADVSDHGSSSITKGHSNDDLYPLMDVSVVATATNNNASSAAVAQDAKEVSRNASHPNLQTLYNLNHDIAVKKEFGAQWSVAK